VSREAALECHAVVFSVEASVTIRTKRVVALAIFAGMCAGITVWFIGFSSWRIGDLEKRLVGTWDGVGTITSEWSLDVTPDPEHGVLGGKSGGRITASSNVSVEFKLDGTYTWRQHDDGGGISITLSMPKEGEEPPHWKVVQSRGRNLTLQIHIGQVVMEFQDENTFTMNLPESSKAEGSYRFQRLAGAKQN
jgi:hypothetical protein